MNKYQEEVDAWFRASDWEYWKPHEMVARLFEEGGELARLINHVYGPKTKKETEANQELEEEIGDILYTLICFANAHNIDIDHAIQGSISKVTTRDKDRYGSHK